MVAPKKERAYEKYSWALLLLVGFFFAVIGVVELIIPTNARPYFSQLPSSTPAVAVNFAAFLVQELGLTDVFLGVLIAVAAWTGFRRGQKWAWYAILWFLVLGLADYVLTGFSLTGNFANPRGLIIPAILAILLLLSYWKFFPKKQVANP